VRFLAKIGLILLYVVAFFIATGLLAQAYTYLTAESYAQGTTPNRNFPMVAVRRNEPASAGVQYQLTHWFEMEKIQRSAAPLTFKLTELQGHFVLPLEGEYQPSVEFKVIETAGDRQLIAVTSMEEDYVFYSKYSTDGTSVWPVSLRIWGANSMVVALVPGLVLTWLLGRAIAWGWKKRSRAQAPVSG
jgi:hypothetical protein